MAHSSIAYRFFSLDAEARYTGVTVRPFGSEETAVAYGEQLLGSAHSVEIWSGETLIRRILGGEAPQPA